MLRLPLPFVSQSVSQSVRQPNTIPDRDAARLFTDDSSDTGVLICRRKGFDIHHSAQNLPKAKMIVKNVYSSEHQEIEY